MVAAASCVTKSKEVDYNSHPLFFVIMASTHIFSHAHILSISEF